MFSIFEARKQIMKLFRMNRFLIWIKRDMRLHHKYFCLNENHFTTFTRDSSCHIDTVFLMTDELLFEETLSIDYIRKNNKELTHAVNQVKQQYFIWNCLQSLPIVFPLFFLLRYLRFLSRINDKSECETDIYRSASLSFNVCVCVL